MSVWNLDRRNISSKAVPKDIVEDYCDELAIETAGKITAIVQKYDGYYTSSQSQKAFDGPFLDVFKKTSLPFDVQSIMGENASDGNNEFVFEVYITSKNTPNYKYRVLIMYYGLLLYPVGVTIPMDIAKEIGMKSEEEYAEDEQELRTIIQKIFGSETIGGILRNLAILNM